MLQNEFGLFILIALIIIASISSVLYIKSTIAEPFEYLVEQMKKREAIDEAKLYKNFEFIQVSKIYHELRNIQKEIEQKNHQLKRDNKEFILSSIHQLKTPLSIISMNVELLEMENENSTLTEYLEQIKASIHLLDLNSQELVYVSMKDDVSFAPSDSNLSQTLQKRVTFFHQIALANEKTIKSDIKENLHVYINQTELERLIDNNISNALKYSDAKSEVIITLSEQDDTINLSFQSTGKTIHQPTKLFNKGYRESKDKDGYGLGLHIIKYICEKYHIDIHLKSEERVTVFQYTFKINKNIT